MKSTIKKVLQLTIIFSLSYLATACDASQNWAIEPGKDGLFRPVEFELQKVNQTSALIRYNRVINASKYIFEFSENDPSGTFENITKRIEILADTLKPFASNSVGTKTEYRTLFENLYGETSYSVRMKAVNANGTLESKHTHSLSFTTLAEQLFKESATIKGLTSITIRWNPTNELSHIVLHPVEAQSDESQDISRELTTIELTKGEVFFEGLHEGTDYQFTIYNNTIKRGRIVVRTLGLPNSGTYEVQSSDDASSIATALSSLITEKKRNIVLAFNGGSSYTIIGLTLPDGIDKISFSGIADTSGNLPEITLSGLKLGTASASLIDINVENMKINGNAANYCIEANQPIASLKNITFNDCQIRNFGRTVVAVSKVDLAIENITIQNSIVSQIGNYGVVNVAGGNAMVNNITFKYCTLIDLTTHFVDIRTGATFTLQNCTFYNNTNVQLDRVLRSNDSAPFPQGINIIKCIFAGANNGKKMGLTYKSGTNTAIMPVLSFSGSYTSAEFPLEFALSSYPNLETIETISNDLFVDPINENFRIKPEVVFAGKGVAGDSRWFE